MPSHNQISDKIIITTDLILNKPSGELREQLISLINELIDRDFHTLVQLLYRIDVDEKKVKQVLQEHTGADSASIIADLIIKRQSQKIATKKKLSGNAEPGPGDSW